MTHLKNIISKFSKKKICVIGDLILDQYIVGSVLRISPEAPVPIVLQEESSFNPGGAANVAYNLKALGADVTQIGRIGEDIEGTILKDTLKKKGINTKGIFADSSLPTILKTRVVARHHQIVRIDKEKTNSVGNPKTTKKIFDFIHKNLADFDAVIISDYGKGLISPELVNLVRDLALKNKIIITVDPKVEHFGYYRNVTAITPNRKETENAIRDIKIKEHHGSQLEIYNDHLDSPRLIDQAGENLLKFLDLESLLITLGEDGMRLFERGKKPVAIATRVREVYDVTGAGDTVISVFTLSLACGSSKADAAHLANCAAGIVVGKMGAATVTKEELLGAVK